jgi:hypothetical protein
VEDLVPIWNRIKDEMERAGRAAHSAIDEGKLRLDLMRARQSADRCAKHLGYAVYKAKSAGQDLAEDVYNRHASDLKAAEAEIARLKTLLDEAAAHRTGAPAPDASAPPEPPTAAEPAAPPPGA